MIVLYIYIVGFIFTGLCIRWFPSLNQAIHDNVDLENPAVGAIIAWPITLLWVSIYHGIMCMTASVNWFIGNGFVIKTQELERNKPNPIPFNPEKKIRSAQ